MNYKTYLSYIKIIPDINNIIDLLNIKIKNECL